MLALLLTGCGHGADTATSHADALKVRLTDAESLAQSGQSEEAMEAFYQIAVTIPDTSSYGDICPIVIEALDDIAECSGMIGDPLPMAERLQALDDHPTNLLQRCCMRDLHATTAYLWLRCDSISRAGALITKALDTSMYQPDDYRYFRDYAYAGQIFVIQQDMTRQVIDWLELALQHAAKCSPAPKRTSYVRSLLGTIYNWQGQIDQAFAMLNENYKQAVAEGDTIAQIYALNTLSNLYDFWEIYPESNKYSDLAVALTESKGDVSPLVMGDTYTLKAGAVKNVHPDSVMHYVAKGEEALKSYPYNMGRENLDYIAADYEYNHGNVDSAKVRLRRFVQNAHPMKRHAAYYMLAKICLSENDVREGERMLDSMYVYSHMVDSIPTESREALEFALAHYIAVGNDDKIILYATDISNCGFYGRDKSIKDRLVTSIIDFQTAQAKDEVEKMALQLRMRNYYYLAVIAGCVAVILVLIFAMMMVRRRIMSKHLKTVNENKQLQEQLDQVITESEITKQNLDTILDDTVTRRVSERISVSLIKERGETEFRNRFHILYPEFESRLKALNARIGPREEMMCMLFVLGADSSTVADTLFIERKSVNVARYRMRKKFGLDENQSLDNFLIQLAKGQVAPDTQD